MPMILRVVLLLVVAAGCSYDPVAETVCDDAIDRGVMRVMMRTADSSSLLCAQNTGVSARLQQTRAWLANAPLDYCTRAAYRRWLSYFEGELASNERECAEDARKEQYLRDHPVPRPRP